MCIRRALAISTLLIVLATGCSNNGQKFNPWIGYGSPRIPAPATGSAGAASGATPDPYYGKPGTAVVAPGQTSSVLPIGAGPQAVAQPNGWQASAVPGTGVTAASSAATQGQPLVNPTIATVGFEQPVAAEAAAQQPATNSVLDRIRNQRMHVNDAANPVVPQSYAAPQTFAPPQTAQPLSSAVGTGTIGAGAVGTGVAHPAVAQNPAAPQQVPVVTAAPVAAPVAGYQWGAPTAGTQVAQAQPAVAYGVLAAGSTAPQASAAQTNVASTGSAAGSSLGWRSKSSTAN